MSPGVELHNDTNQDNNRRIQETFLATELVGNGSSDERASETASLQSRHNVGLQIGELDLGSRFGVVKTKSSGWGRTWSASKGEHDGGIGRWDRSSFSYFLNSSNTTTPPMMEESMPKSIAPKPA